MEMDSQLRTLVTLPSVTIQQNTVAKRLNHAPASYQIPAMQAFVIINKQTKYCTDKTGEQNGFLKGRACCERYFSETHHQKTKKLNTGAF
jgi:hypothetical protein